MYSPTVVHVSLTVLFAAGATRRSSLACLVFIAAVANVDRAPLRYVMYLRGVFCFKALSERFTLRCVDSFRSLDYSELTGNVFPNTHP
jgi:hypothetical protein